MAAADVDIMKPITITTFHPEWETVERKFWLNRFLLLLFAGFLLLVILGIGLNPLNSYSVMPALFSGEVGGIRIAEFTLWFVNCFLFLDLVLIANHKTHTTKIKYELSKNEEMRVSISFNRALSRLFIGIFIFTFLKIVIKEILGLKFEDSNIWRFLLSDCLSPKTVACTWQVWLINALYVCIGFGAYSQFLYVFEKSVQGRKHPFLWIITPIGLFIMVFLPYNVLVVTFVFTSTLQWPMTLYFFGQWLALIGGGIMVPILYIVMGRRFAYSGLTQTSTDCYNKGIGFTIAALGAVFDVVAPINTGPITGGIFGFFEVLGLVFMAPLLTFIGIILVRKAYRPRG